MSSDTQLAEEIFLKYCGSYFHMMREDEEEYKLYQSFNISREQERVWIKEFQKELLVKIQGENEVGHNFYCLLQTIKDYRSLNVLNELVNYMNLKKDVLDTFSMMLMAEGVLGKVEDLRKYHRTVKLAKVASINILEFLLVRPISIAPAYLQRTYLTELNDQYIQNRIREELARWVK